VAEWASTARNVSSASNRGRTTTLPPYSTVISDQMSGPLWYSGPGITRQPCVPRTTTGGASRSSIAGSPDTISFGRPVEPPDVGAFHALDTTSGNGSASAGRRGAR
jgi:hypothetical protein